MDRKKLLVVDDIEINRLVVSELFSDEFDVVEAENGLEALKKIMLHESELAIVLLDLVMPVMDGFEVLKEMNRTSIIQKIPVIMITGENDDDKALQGYGLGVSDLVHKPFNPDIIKKRVKNVIDLYSYKNYLEEKLVEQRTEIEKQSLKIRQSNLFLIDALSTTVEFRDMESGEHIKRIRVLTKLLLEQLREYYPLTAEQIESISNASALHDIGKIAIPDAILTKPGRLTEEEFEIMKTHTVKGCEILETLKHFEDRDYYRYSYDICRYHHERWDGKGYPDGIAGDTIPIWAQATSLSDVYDALTNTRVYKPAFSHEVSIQMILEGKCGTFNPKILECFSKIDSTVEKIYSNMEEYERYAYDIDKSRNID